MRTVTVSLMFLAITACENPADDVAKATVEDAKAPSAAAAPAAGGKALAIDTATSKVEWTGSKVTGKHDGGFKAFTGTITLNEKALEASAISVEIETGSLYSDSEKLTGHLKSADFFNSEAHPKATFVSTKIEKGGANGATHTIHGNLTLNGIAKTITFPAVVKMDGGKVSATSEFSINRKDFKMEYPGMPDDLIRDEVVIRLTVNAAAAQS